MKLPQITAKTTGLLLVIVAAFLLFWEGLVIFLHVPQGTISESVWAYAYGNPWFPFAFGFLCGHLFWQSKAAAAAIGAAWKAKLESK